MLKAHQQRISLGCGVEDVCAAVFIEVCAAQSGAAALSQRVVLRLRPFSGLGLQQHHEARAGQERDVVASVAIQISGGQHLGVVSGGVEREFAFGSPGTFVVLHAQHELFLVRDEGDVSFLIAIPVSDGQSRGGMADDERLLVKAGDFQDGIPAVGAGGLLRCTRLHAVFALQEELDARAC